MAALVAKVADFAQAMVAASDAAAPEKLTGLGARRPPRRATPPRSEEGERCAGNTDAKGDDDGMSIGEANKVGEGTDKVSSTGDGQRPVVGMVDKVAESTEVSTVTRDGQGPIDERMGIVAEGTEVDIVTRDGHRLIGEKMGIVAGGTEMTTDRRADGSVG